MGTAGQGDLARDALGVGLRPEFYPTLLALLSQLQVSAVSGLPDYFEIIVENYLNPTSLARDNLRRIAPHFPLVGHGVSLNLLGADALDFNYLAQVRDIVREFSLPFYSDHLCWTAHLGVTHHDLLPAPYTRDLVGYAAERAARVQDYLGVPFGIENLSSYVSFKQDELPEWEFYRQVVEQSGCWSMLDINNIYVSSVNHKFNTKDYLASINWKRVLQVHLAGYSTRADGVLHDTHDQSVSTAVWQLYADAWALGGPFPTLLERDDNIPSLSQVVSELQLAKQVRYGSTQVSKLLT